MGWIKGVSEHGSLFLGKREGLLNSELLMFKYITVYLSSYLFSRTLE